MTEDELQAAFPPGEYHSLQEVATANGVTRQRIHQLVNLHGIVREPRPVESLSARQIRRRFPHSPWPRQGSIIRYKNDHGLCLTAKCYDPRVPHRRRCAPHLAENSERAQARYQREKKR